MQTPQNFPVPVAFWAMAPVANFLVIAQATLFRELRRPTATDAAPTRQNKRRHPNAAAA